MYQATIQEEQGREYMGLLPEVAKEIEAGEVGAELVPQRKEQIINIVAINAEILTQPRRETDLLRRYPCDLTDDLADPSSHIGTQCSILHWNGPPTTAASPGLGGTAR